MNVKQLLLLFSTLLFFCLSIVTTPTISNIPSGEDYTSTIIPHGPGLTDEENSH
jgi:hypothetical protein